jgi:hypothetical protein
MPLLSRILLQFRSYLGYCYNSALTCRQEMDSLLSEHVMALHAGRKGYVCICFHMCGGVKEQACVCFYKITTSCALFTALHDARHKGYVYMLSHLSVCL